VLAPEPAERRQGATLAGELGITRDAHGLASCQLAHRAAVGSEGLDVTGFVRGEHQHGLVPAADAVIGRAAKPGVASGAGESSLWANAEDRAVARPDQRGEMIRQLGHVVVAHRRERVSATPNPYEQSGAGSVAEASTHQLTNKRSLVSARIPDEHALAQEARPMPE
jgi:hypothetical protein